MTIDSSRLIFLICASISVIFFSVLCKRWFSVDSSADLMLIKLMTLPKRKDGCKVGYFGARFCLVICI